MKIEIDVYPGDIIESIELLKAIIDKEDKRLYLSEDLKLRLSVVLDLLNNILTVYNKQNKEKLEKAYEEWSGLESGQHGG